MAAATWFFTFICVAGRHLSSASPVLRSALVVPAGHNASLTCNLTSGSGITWYLLRSDRVRPLLTVTSSKLGGVTVVVPSQPADQRLASRGDPDRGPLHLDILQLQEPDAGLYFCSARCEEAACVSGETRLLVGGPGGVWESVRPPCWSLGICVLPALLVLFLVFIVGLCLCTGKPAVCCQRVTEEEDLHYSSLRHARKPRPSGRGGTGLVEDDVTYSAVTSRKNPIASRDRR